MRLILFFSLIFFTSLNYADYSVDYGDGTTTIISAQPWTSGKHPQIASHQYSTDGIYTVTISADVDCDSDGIADTDKLVDTLQVIVGNVKQQWDYGDGQRTTSNTDPCSQALTAQPHQYTEVGTYTVTYTAIETNGQITTDTIEVTVTDGTSTCATFRDEFSTASYSQQDGTANWSTNWDEYEGVSPTIPEAITNPTSGHVQIFGGQLTLNNYSPETQNFPGVERELDLSPYSNATFSFDFITSGNVDSSDSIVVMASANGGTNWTILEDIRGINDTSGSKSYDLTPYISSNTKIRIRINNESVSGLGTGCCYGGSPETFSIDNIQIEACNAGGGGSTELADNFNCIETTATDDNAAIKQIYTKLSGTRFNLDIVALKNNTVIKNNYNKTVMVEVIDQTNGNTIYSDANFEFVIADNARKQLSLQIDTPYKDLLCRITYTAGATTTIGESDNFSVRPTSLTITSNLTNISSSGTPKAKAGENFTLTATSIMGYNGTPKINNTNILAHAGAVQAGTISGSFNAADSATGIATGNAFSYTEVGSLQFTAYGVYDDSFTAVDQPNDCTNDFSNTFVSGKLGCKFGNTASTAYFGRFTPDHFEITATENGSFSDACTGFSYSGQSISYTTNPELTVTAYNAIGGITQNYRQSYAKLDPLTDFNVTAPTTDATQLGADAINKVNLTWTPGTASLTDNLNGSLTFAFGNDSFMYLHEANSLIAPFPAAADLIFTAINDSDGITTQGLPQTLQPSGTSIRFGRLNIDNAHGSELLPLAVPIYTEYYNGTFFIAATDDNCTTVDLAQLRFNGAVTPSLGATTVSAGLNFTAPGTGNTGYIDITTDLFVASFPWLTFDWNADGSYDNSPSARASFGLFKGNSKQIYFREIY